MENRSSHWRGLVALSLVLATGCVSADLSSDAKITSEVKECLPPGTPAPSMVATAVWFHNANGFASADDTGMGHESGVVALAGDRLWFMTWNEPERHFDVQTDIACLPALKVEVVHGGLAAMLVIQSSNRSFDSFELMHGGRIGSDPAATQSLCDRILALRAQHPQIEQ